MLHPPFKTKNDKHFPTNHNIFWIHGLTNFVPNAKNKSLKTFNHHNFLGSWSN